MITGLGSAPLPFPLTNEHARAFWTGIDEDRLLLPRCSACARWQWYPAPTGPCCAGAEFEWQQLPGTGSVFTHTTVRHAFLPSLAPALPLTVALINLDGARDVRFVGLLDVSRPQIAMLVTMRIRRFGDRKIPVFESIP